MCKSCYYLSMKGSTYKKPTLFSATRTLQRFFAPYPEANSITKEEMIASWGRDKPEFEKVNEAWLSGKLTALYTHSLVRAVYSYNPWKKLEHIELTAKGKVALGRDDAPTNVEEVGKEATSAIRGNKTLTIDNLTVDDIMMALPKINDRLPTHKVRLVFEDKEAQPAN